ncbi:ATP-dependent Clp protease proteolytic subunit [Microbaculum marinum]|uniref:ATP-dependent Clp protease proteolytic subunit n=1 Tax=Microbaculum marinum TaxID=1764581 RepID=A0AAW9RNM2_9HYPH
MSLAGHHGDRPGQGRFRRWLRDRPDETILKWAFRGLLVATVVVLATDLSEMREQADEFVDPAVPGVAPEIEPYLPSIREGVPARPGDTAPGALREAARFELVADGRLLLEGGIDTGAATRFAEEIEKRGSYVKTVVLNSPGGSVGDALEIARMIRDGGYDTAVEAGGYCASSCPLLLAGGNERVVAEDASVGVHRVYSAGEAAVSAAVGMDNAQRVSAECQRFLLDMGVDPRVWIHAMETPKDELFYFTPDELLELRLATGIAPSG